MVTRPASSAENGDPAPPPGPPPPLNSSLPPPATDALPGGVVPSALRMPFVQPPFRRACTRRWLNEVDPTVYRGEWTEEEKSRLRDLVETLRTPDKVKGNTASSWSVIAELLAAGRSPPVTRTAAWSKCPLQSSEFRGCPLAQHQPVRPHPSLQRRPPALAQGHPEDAHSRPERRALAAWMPKRGCSGALLPAQSS